jgi:hypothetical protein
MKRPLLQFIASSLLVGTFARASLAAWSFPGENQHERYTLSFRSNEDPTRSCNETAIAGLASVSRREAIASGRS